MNKIHNDIEKYEKLNPRYYCFLKEISFKRDINDMNSHLYSVEIILSKDENKCHDFLKIVCYELSDIKINNIEGFPGILIRVIDIKSRQLENCKYQIVDEEENTFSFKCNDFFAEIIA